MTLLTADLCARAIIASSIAAGLDPLLVCTTKANAKRGPLAPAAFALAEVTGHDIDRLAKALGISEATVTTYQRINPPNFLRMKAAALDAARYALRSAERRQEAPPAVARPTPAAVAVEPVRRAPAPPATPSAVRSPVEPTVCAPIYRPPARPDVSTAPVRFLNPPPPPPLSLGARILAELAERPLSQMALASILGEKEMVVIQAMSVLALEGRVVGSDNPAGGPRHRTWRVAA